MKCLSLLFVAISFISISVFASTKQIAFKQTQNSLKTLEESFNGKIGVYAIDTNSYQIVAYRADERFPVQSTMKLLAVAALLKQSQDNENLLKEKIHYNKKNLISWHPITGKYINSGMTLESLAEAAISYSDNPAINIIMQRLGGPTIVTNFAHSIGSQSFNVTHYDGNLNSNPENIEDTATPKDMANSVQKITLGHVLNQAQREKLITWMRNNKTSYRRIRAATPIGWTVADKTGSGDYGIANDIGILWSPLCKPIVLAIYTIQNKPDAKSREDIVASTASIILNEFEKNDSCFKALSE